MTLRSKVTLQAKVTPTQQTRMLTLNILLQTAFPLKLLEKRILGDVGNLNQIVTLQTSEAVFFLLHIKLLYVMTHLILLTQIQYARILLTPPFTVMTKLRIYTWEHI